MKQTLLFIFACLAAITAGAVASACTNLSGWYKTLDSTWGPYSVQMTQNGCALIHARWIKGDGTPISEVTVIADGKWYRHDEDIGYILKRNLLTETSWLDQREYHELNKIRTSQSEWRLEDSGNLIFIGTGTDPDGAPIPNEVVHYQRY